MYSITTKDTNIIKPQILMLVKGWLNLFLMCKFKYI